MDNMICILKEIIDGVVPKGYVAYQGSEKIYTIKNHITLREKIKYVGPTDTVHVWEIKNNSIFGKLIFEKDLNFAKTIWIHLGKTCLKGHEKTFAITAIKNH